MIFQVWLCHLCPDSGAKKSKRMGQSRESDNGVDINKEYGKIESTSEKEDKLQRTKLSFSAMRKFRLGHVRDGGLGSCCAVCGQTSKHTQHHSNTWESEVGKAWGWKLFWLENMIIEKREIEVCFTVSSSRFRAFYKTEASLCV